MGIFNRNALDFRQGVAGGRTYARGSNSGLSMVEEIEKRLRSGEHGARVNALLGSNPATADSLQAVMKKIGIAKI